MPLYESKTQTYQNTCRASLQKRVDSDLPFKKSKKKKKGLKTHHDNMMKKKKRKFSEKGGSTSGADNDDSSFSLQALVTGELKSGRSKSNPVDVAMGISVNRHETCKRRERKKRFDEDCSRKELSINCSMGEPRTVSVSPKKGKNSSDFAGTCMSLEKPYLRLTTHPRPEAVRPLHVLKKSFEHIKTHYVETEDFDWSNEQLKSLRQDLSVQGIRNNFALAVYETHARLVLEHGDMNEFNQCQSVITSMTIGVGSVGIKTASHPKKSKGKPYIACNSYEHETYLRQTRREADEFAAYRLLYALVQKDVGGIKKELGAASSLIPLDQLQKTHRCQGVSSCRHAVLVTKALIHSDYHMFFALYENAPNLSGYLMDFLVHRVRISAYQRIVSSFRPTLSVEFFRETLNFADLEDTRRFLKQNNAIFVKEKGDIGPPFWVDCKLSL